MIMSEKPTEIYVRAKGIKPVTDAEPSLVIIKSEAHIAKNKSAKVKTRET